MVVMEASVAQRNANLFRRGASPRADGALAAGEGRSGASVSSAAPPPAWEAMTTASVLLVYSCCRQERHV